MCAGWWRTRACASTATPAPSPPLAATSSSCTRTLCTAASALPATSAPTPPAARQGWKKPVGFLGGFGGLWFFGGFFRFFWVFLGFIGFFLVFFWFFYIFAQKRDFLGFFSVKNTFRCIQTLNYNHSYPVLINLFLLLYASALD
jgi:hypothetical protein